MYIKSPRSILLRSAKGSSSGFYVRKLPAGTPNPDNPTKQRESSWLKMRPGTIRHIHSFKFEKAQRLFLSGVRRINRYDAELSC